jgi:hypothetical protein
VAAVTATQRQEAVGQDAAFQEGVELVLHELRQVAPAASIALCAAYLWMPTAAGTPSGPRGLCDRLLWGDEFTAAHVAEGSFAASHCRVRT